MTTHGLYAFGAHFFISRDRPSFLLLRRATRLRRELHEVVRALCLYSEFARGIQRNVDEVQGAAVHS